MGIKFDVLSDVFMLIEDSQFSKFFTGSEPIKKIHKELRILHGDDLVMNPSDNRHELWDAARTGKGIFVVVYKSKTIIEAKNELIKFFKAHPPRNTRLSQTYNEIKDDVRRIIASLPNDKPATTEEFKTIQSIVEGAPQNRNKTPVRKKSLRTKIAEVYPNDWQKFFSALDTFMNEISNADRILIKRIAQPAEAARGTPTAFLKPDQRYFKVAQREGQKIFGQQYMIWFFNKDKFLGARTIQANATDLWKPWKGGITQLGGWGERDYYIIENEKFAQSKKQPLEANIPPANVVLPLKAGEVDKFVSESFNMFKRVMLQKMSQGAESMRTKAVNDIGDTSTSDEESLATAKEYRALLKTIASGLQTINKTQMFYNFLSKDTMLDLNQYEFIDTTDPYIDTSDPLAGEPSIHISPEELNSKMARVKASALKRISADPTGHSISHLAIAFKTDGMFSQFRRRFISYVLRQLIKTSQASQLDTLLDMI
jgi:hypothetical protein